MEDIEEEYQAVCAVEAWIASLDWNFVNVRKRRRQASEKTNLWDSPWGQMLQDPEILVPSSKISKLF